MKELFFLAAVCSCLVSVAGPLSYEQLDSIRREHNIPELGYAVVNMNGISDIKLCGYHSSESKDTAAMSDYFHLGSNTKAITGYIAAWLVEKNLIKWDTKFFDLFPEWGDSANKTYENMTLQMLLSHRARLRSFTGMEDWEGAPEFSGNKSEQRRAFVRYVVKLEPALPADEVYSYSNAGYTAASLMLEKASGETWEELVKDLLEKEMKLHCSFGWPTGNNPWGHWLEDGQLVALPPTIDYKLNCIEPAGDICMTLPDYAEFIRKHLEGLQGKDNILKHDTYRFLHYGMESYAVGWGNGTDNEGKKYSAHEGSAGTFDVLTYIAENGKEAYVVFSNEGDCSDTLLSIVKSLSE